MFVLLEILHEVVQYVLKLVLDIIALAAFLVSLVAFWRWPSVVGAIGRLLDRPYNEAGRNRVTRGELRRAAIACFLHAAIDVIVAPLLAVCLVSWRCFFTVSLLRAARADPLNAQSFNLGVREVEYNASARVAIIIAFALLLLDAVQAPMILFVLGGAVWRMPVLLRDCLSQFQQHGAALLPWTVRRSTTPPYMPSLTSTNGRGFRSIIWAHFGHGLIDVLLLPFALIILLTVYRVPRTWRMLFPDGFSLATARVPLPPPPSSPNARRVPVYATLDEAELAEARRFTTMQRKALIFLQAARVVFDALACVGTAFVIVTVLQAPALVSDLRHYWRWSALPPHLRERAAAPTTILTQRTAVVEGQAFVARMNRFWWSRVAYHACLVPLNAIFGLPPLLIVVCSLYRLFFFLRDVRERTQRWALSTQPAVRVTSYTVEAPKEGRNGIVIRVRGTKAPEFTLGANGERPDVALYVRNASFWRDGIQPALGQMQSSIGQALLPLHLVPAYWANPAQELQAGETECELVFDFSSAPASTSCIARNAKRAGMTPLVLQVEYNRGPSMGWRRSLSLAFWGSGADPLWPNDIRGAHAAPTQTLLCLSMPNVSQLEDIIKHGTVMVPDDGAVAREWQTVTIAPYYRVWALVALRQAGLVIWDLAAVVLFMLLHVFPHRVRVVYQSAFEGPQRRAARRVVKEMRWTRELVSRATGETERCIAELDRATREGVLTEPLELTPEFIRAGTRQTRNIQVLQSYASLLPSHAGGAHRIAQQLFRDSETAVRAFVLSLVVAFPRPVVTGHTRFPSQVTPVHDDLSLGEDTTTDDEETATSTATRTDSLRWRQTSRTASGFSASVDGGDVASANSDDDWRPPPAAASASDAIVRPTRSAGDGTESALSMTIGTPNIAVAHADEASVVDPILDAVFERSGRVSHFPLPEAAASGDSHSDAPSRSCYALPPDVNVAAETAAIELLRAADAEHAVDRPNFYVNYVRARAADALEQLRALDAQSDRVIAEAGRAVDTRGDGWIGFRTRVTEQVLETAYDLAAVAVCVAITATVYRAPWLWRRLLRSANPRRQCLIALGELLLDLEFFIKAWIVILCVRGALDLPLDLAIWLPRYPSFRVARGVVQHHYRRALDNLIEVVRLLFTGRAIKFVLATAAFALLAPAVMFESWLPAARRTRFAVVALLAATLAWMFVLPVQVSRHYRPEAPLVYWAPMLIFVVLGNALAIVRRDPQIVELRRAIVHHARPTWHNAGPFVLAAVEFLQLAAVGLMAVPGAAARASGDDLDGVGGFAVRAARAILLLDGSVTLPARVGGGTAPLGPVFTVVAMGVYFLGAAMPVVTWHILGWRSGRLLPSSTAWIAFMRLFGPGVQTIAALHLAGLLRCDAGIARLYEFDYASTSTACWAPDSLHSHLAFAGMVLGVFYFPTVLTRNAMYDESTAVALDVVIAQLYRMLTGLAAVAAAVVVGGFPSLPLVGTNTAVAVLASAIWSLSVSLFYGRVLNPIEKSFTTFPALATVKVALYAVLIPVAAVFCAASASSGAATAYTRSDTASAAAAGLFTGVAGLLMAVAVAFAHARGLFSIGRHAAKTFHAQATIDVARQQLLALEEGLHARGMLNGTWGPQRDAWRRRCLGALRDSTLAVAAVELERCVVAPALDAVYVRSRPVWVAHADTLTDDVDRGVVEMNVNSLVNFGRSTGRRNGFFARLVGVDGPRPAAAAQQRADEQDHRRRDRRPPRRPVRADESATEEEEELVEPPAAEQHEPSRFGPEVEAARAETLLRLVQGLCNGVTHSDVQHSIAVSRLLSGDVSVAVTSLHRPLPLR